MHAPPSEQVPGNEDNHASMVRACHVRAASLRAARHAVRASPAAAAAHCRRGAAQAGARARRAGAAAAAGARSRARRAAGRAGALLVRRAGRRGRAPACGRARGSGRRAGAARSGLPRRSRARLCAQAGAAATSAGARSEHEPVWRGPRRSLCCDVGRPPSFRARPGLSCMPERSPARPQSRSWVTLLSPSFLSTQGAGLLPTCAQSTKRPGCCHAVKLSSDVGNNELLVMLG